MGGLNLNKHLGPFAGVWNASTTAFVPSDIGGLILHYDASDAASIGSLNNLDPIPTWTDLSVSGNNATQGTAANRPTYYSAVFGTNLAPAASFDGTTDFMDLDSGIADGARTVFYAVKKAATANHMSPLGSVADSNYPYWDYSGNTLYLRNNVGYDTKTGGGGADARLVCVTSDASTDIKYYKNDTLISTAFTASNSAQSLTLLGKTNALLSKGYIAEVIYYNSVLSTDEITQVNDYMNAKYGIY